jgi:hypothetical protein
MDLYQFRDNLLAVKGAAIVTIHTETVPAMRKTDNPYVGVVKKSAVNGIINWVYESCVNRQRVREGMEADFSAFPRKWGQRIKGTPLVEHKGQHYLEMKVQSAQARYFLGTREVTHEEIKPYLRAASPSRQGVEKEVILRDYALENIKAVVYGGETIPIG